MKKNAAAKKFQVPSDFSEVRQASADVLDFLKPLSLDSSALFDLRLCLEEALINAIKYGNRQQKEVPVDLEVEFDENEIRLHVEDKGEGFDFKSLEDCTDEHNRLKNRGRGVFLIRQLMDKVDYNEKGNGLWMVKYLKK